MYDPIHPVVYSYIELDGVNYALKHKESHIYVSSTSGLHIIDISNPSTGYLGTKTQHTYTINTVETSSIGTRNGLYVRHVSVCQPHSRIEAQLT